MRKDMGLFRGKRDDGKWVFGDLCHDWDGIPRCISNYCGSNPVAPNTVGECTMMKDKNGKSIFEGDILQFNYIGENRGVEGVAAVEFCNGKFGVLWGWHRDFVSLDGFANTTIEIIGNVIDNPELLERGVDNA